MLFGKLFWVTVRRVWSEWRNSLIVVTPETVVGWHRAGFRFYWQLISRIQTHVGRKRVSKEVRDLIFPHGRREPDVGSAADSR